MCCTYSPSENEKNRTFTVSQIGEVLKENGQTFIVLDKKYKAGLVGLENFPELTVIYWFDQNDTPEKRAILKVHPQGNKDIPIRGVFATHAPARPNLIAISRCKIMSIKDNMIEIDEIDAFNHSPVLDLKN